VTGLHVVVVTGMSGAGRSTALHVLEDLGFFCVDNLPPALAPQLLDELDDDPEIRAVGLGMDVRTRAFLEGAPLAFKRLEEAGHDVEVLFLDCADDVLVRRFSETRRPHALGATMDLPSAIKLERDRLATLRVRARHVIDTTRLSVHDLRRALVEHVGADGRSKGMTIRVISFGFKFGLPVDADLVFDLRYLPNPHFVPELRPLTGTDASVSSYVLEAAETIELLERIVPLLETSIPHYEREGKSYLTIAVGCTGGRHRSVAVAEELARRIGEGREVAISHRDVARST
jgi:UPF0042 nucleotide-binding protein